MCARNTHKVKYKNYKFGNIVDVFKKVCLQKCLQIIRFCKCFDEIRTIYLNVMEKNEYTANKKKQIKYVFTSLVLIKCIKFG